MSYFLIAIIVLVLIFGLVVFRGSPYVPSHKLHVREAFSELYKIGPGDLLVDIGSGDGVILREASQTGARAVGFEINPILVIISRLLCRKNNNIEIRLSDFWLSKFPDETTVVYVFSATRDVNKILKFIQKQSNRLQKPIYLISYGS